MFQDIPMEQVYTFESFSQPYEQLKKEECGAFGNVYKVGMHSLILFWRLHIFTKEY